MLRAFSLSVVLKDLVQALSSALLVVEEIMVQETTRGSCVDKQAISFLREAIYAILIDPLGRNLMLFGYFGQPVFEVQFNIVLHHISFGVHFDFSEM